MTEDSLIRSLREPESRDDFNRALSELFRFYYPRLLRVAARHCGDAAEDALQETWIKIAKRIDRFEPGTNFAAWASMVTANTARDFLKKRVPNRFPENFDPPSPNQISPLELAESDEKRRRALGDCLEGVTAKERTVIERRLSGDTTSEIAELISLSIERVYSLWTEGTKKLRVCVERRLSV